MNKEIKAIDAERLYLTEFRDKFLSKDSQGYRDSLEYEIELLNEKNTILKQEEEDHQNGFF